MAQQIHYSVVEAQNKSLGQSGSILIDQDTTDQDATCAIGEGVFGAIQFIEDTVFATLTPDDTTNGYGVGAYNGDSLSGVAFPAGMTIYGKWTAFTLSAGGSVIAYQG